MCRCLDRERFPSGMVQVFGKARVPIRHGAGVWEGQGSHQAWCRCLGRPGFPSGMVQMFGKGRVPVRCGAGVWVGKGSCQA